MFLSFNIIVLCGRRLPISHPFGCFGACRLDLRSPNTLCGFSFEEVRSRLKKRNPRNTTNSREFFHALFSFFPEDDGSNGPDGGGGRRPAAGAGGMPRRIPVPQEAPHRRRRRRRRPGPEGPDLHDVLQRHRWVRSVLLQCGNNRPEKNNRGTDPKIKMSTDP